MAANPADTVRYFLEEESGPVESTNERAWAARIAFESVEKCVSSLTKELASYKEAVAARFHVDMAAVLDPKLRELSHSIDRMQVAEAALAAAEARERDLNLRLTNALAAIRRAHHASAMDCEQDVFILSEAMGNDPAFNKPEKKP